MAAIDKYIDQIQNESLREQLRNEVVRLTKTRNYGLVFENHLPDNVLMYDVEIRKGIKVSLRGKTPNDVYEVLNIQEGRAMCALSQSEDIDFSKSSNGKDTKEAICRHLITQVEKTFLVSDLVAVAQQGDPIYPYLKQLDYVENAPGSDLWHTLIEADNFQALQLLAYLYPGMLDCIYIDPPYNKPDSHDWKYNCDYVDGADKYRHSKWLSMMEERLRLAKKLLNPEGSVLIVTIDELEYKHLGCLLEQIFPEVVSDSKNLKIQMITSVISAKGVVRSGKFSRVEEYIYVIEIGNSPLSQGEINMLDNEIKKESNRKIDWLGFRRRAPQAKRESRPHQFYPVYVDTTTGYIHSIGDVVPQGVDRNTVPVPENCIALWPLNKDGEERLWSLVPEQARINWGKGYLKVNWNRKKNTGTVYYLAEGTIADIENGNATTLGYHPDGAINAFYKIIGTTPPKRVWNMGTHNAETYGTKILSSIIGDRFSYPKSLYAVHDIINFYVADKPNALILDFFAGSGTTLHAVNLINKEDGGKRRCIMVTNNEIGEPKENELIPLKIKPGDEEWEKWGIARYVNWPRTKYSILGIDLNDNKLVGDYLTSKTEEIEVERRFSQINFISPSATLKQKKALITLINKQKNVKLPNIKVDSPYVIPQTEEFNSSILFDINSADEWMDELNDKRYITDLYIVTDRDSIYKSLKDEISDMMGSVSETVPLKYPMSDGFHTNAIYFKLGFLDKKNIALGRQLSELISILWMKAGAHGRCPSMTNDELMVLPENRMAILIEGYRYNELRDNIRKYPEIETVFIVEDSDDEYRALVRDLNVKHTYQLYRDYLDNFKINTARTK